MKEFYKEFCKIQEDKSKENDLMKKKIAKIETNILKMLRSRLIFLF